MTLHDENYDEWLEQEIMRAEAERDYTKDEKVLEALERSASDECR